jgi:hypothetical protein
MLEGAFPGTANEIQVVADGGIFGTAFDCVKPNAALIAGAIRSALEDQTVNADLRYRDPGFPLAFVFPMNIGPRPSLRIGVLCLHEAKATRAEISN